MNPRVAVTVGNVDLFLGRQSHVSAAIERLATLIRGGLAWDTEGKEDFAIQGAFAHRVIPVIGQIKRVIRSHGDTVGAFEVALAPGTQKITMAIEDDHRMRAPGKAVHIVIPVDTDGGDF